MIGGKEERNKDTENKRTTARQELVQVKIAQVMASQGHNHDEIPIHR
jgi:hypothetical protein